MEIKKRRNTSGPMLLLVCGILFLSVIAAAADEATDQKVDYEAGFYYTVKKGDTLWDLSQRFSDTPWQWPDLWKENKQIPNPHWIYPGERIRLYRKTSEQTVAEQPTQAVPAVTAQAQANAPVTEPAPQVDYHYVIIDQVGFIRKPAVQPLGKIFKSLENAKLISKYDTVYMSYETPESKSQFAPGSRMTIYRTMSPTDRARDIDDIGTQHFPLGIVEITQMENDYAIGKVVQSYIAIEPGDMLMPYEPKSPDIPVLPTPPGIDGKIISNQRHTKLLSYLFVAFIDKGADDGLKPGNLLNIFQQESASPNGGGKIDLAPVYCGSMIVLHTENTTSTAVITHSVRNIAAGYLVRTP